MPVKARLILMYATVIPMSAGADTFICDADRYTDITITDTTVNENSTQFLVDTQEGTLRWTILEGERNAEPDVFSLICTYDENLFYETWYCDVPRQGFENVDFKYRRFVITGTTQELVDLAELTTLSTTFTYVEVFGSMIRGFSGFCTKI